MKRLALIGSLMLLPFCLASCHRRSCEVWEDTKTCSRYMSKGFRSLMGSHGDPYNHAYNYSPKDDEFLVLSDEDCYEESFLSDFSDSYERESIPLAEQSPGDPGSPIPGIEGFHAPTGKLAELFSRITFETDKYEVSGLDNLQTIQAIARYMREHPEVNVFVEGHADERGPAAYNLALGSRRANSVRSYLIENGVGANRLYTISFGKERPVVLGHDENSWNQNRRAEFKLYER